MFVDPASSAACVSCHNEHPNSPKTDWKLSDAMGATTWIYPEETVDLVTALRELKMLREATALAYTGYLEKASEFASPPVDIGEKWPAEGAFLPSAPAFMSALDAEVGAASFDILLQTIGD
jgi:adenylate cyclase